MNNTEFAEILKQSYPLETKLQLMMEEYSYCSENIKLYKKVMSLEDDDINQLEKNKQKYQELEIKINSMLSKNSTIDNYIEELNYNEKINGQNYQNLILWNDELQKRNKEDIKDIYEYKLKEISKQEKFINIFGYIRNFTLLFSILFLSLRNFVLQDLMNLLTDNFSKCCLISVVVVELSKYVYRKNKKEFDNIEINYTNNQNVIKLLDINMKTVLLEANCNSIDEYGDVLIENTKRFEKLCGFEDEKNNNKDEIKKLKENQSYYNSKLYKVFSSLNVKMHNSIEESTEEFNQKYMEYLTFKRKYDQFMYEFNNLREEYINKNKYYEKIWLESNT